jgi:hypothetical protein
MHAGRYPSDVAYIPESWNVPAHPGFKLQYRSAQVANQHSATILVFEPEIGDEERFVLLVNGLIGTMRTPELETALTRPTEGVAAAAVEPHALAVQPTSETQH